MRKEKNMEIVRLRPKKLGVDAGADFGERQKLVLESAARLIAESGYAHTTIGDIADDMGISKPVIYHYFSNKDALIRGIFDEGDRVCASGWADIEVDDAPGLEKLQRLFLVQAEFAITDFGRCMINTGYPLLSAETREYKSLADKSLTKELVRLINQGKRDGSIRNCDSKILVDNITAIISQLGRRYDSSFRGLSRYLDETWSNLADGLSPRE